MRIVVAITGASGVQYAYSLLKHFKGEVDLVISEDAKKVIREETPWSPEDFSALASHVYENDEFEAPVASGSSRFDSMVIVPCSMNTLSKIAWGISDNLTTRVAAVCLKEGRKLVVVPRETPLSQINMQNMLRLSRMGVVILPAMPAFYHHPKKMEDLVDFIAGRILDNLGIEHDLYERWKGG